MEIINKLENNLVYYFYTYKALQIENEKSELESNEENIILNRNGRCKELHPDNLPLFTMPIRIFAMAAE